LSFFELAFLCALRGSLLLQNYVASRDVAGLKLGAISDKGNLLAAGITNNGGVPVEKVQVDKNTGWFSKYRGWRRGGVARPVGTDSCDSWRHKGGRGRQSPLF